ncbi:MAG: polysaccharide deacetylase family protein [Lachnospiraceae bacterium]|nr:polysaccharide deacetylase family protein [Lachnospiraceae bacterium]MDE7358983.1 polysaccharide deacetylase family protein [Lachnospiraceae bacterium]
MAIVKVQNRAHGIMYHHFHDEQKHIVGQGSISAESFNDMLDFYGKSHNIIGAEEFLRKSETGTLSPSDVCLTFDDGLLCQYDVAYPVMKDRGLTAFWFIYTSPLDGVMERLEIYRHFRSLMFPDIEDFYAAFFSIVSAHDTEAMKAMQCYNPDEYLKEFPFYTPNDKRFRYMRDVGLGEKKYNVIMDKMLEMYRYDIEKNSQILWLSTDNMRDLRQQGNIIGLHSYSHPTVMIKKNYSEQLKEYATNKRQLEEVLKEEIVAVSYPCNSYNSDTLKCMKELGMKIGFRANMAEVCLAEYLYEYPREDHANIMKAMEVAR